MSSAPPSQDQPLGLTVHTLPEPSQIAQPAEGRTRAGRLKMLAVLLVCAAPVVASYFTAFVWRPEGKPGFGELVEPQRPLPDIVGATLDGKAVQLRALRDQWLLISVATASCDPQCAQNLYLQRQLREMLGKEKDRVDWVWLVSDTAPVAEALLPGLKEATVVRLPASELAKWLEPQAGSAMEDHLYLVDPMGKLMMRFPAHLDAGGASKVKRDLDRLLRASAGWDKPGRVTSQ